MANFIPKITYTELFTLTPKTITFETPPEGDPLNEAYNASTKVTTSNNGTRQTQFNYLKKSYDLEFLFVSETIKNQFLDFYKNHAVRGGKFEYFIHSDEVESETFYFPNKGFKPSRPIPNGTGDFEYDFKFKIERVESGV